MVTKKTQKNRAMILYEPFGWPLLPFGIYEINEFGGVIRELARATSLQKAKKLCQEIGYDC